MSHTLEQIGAEIRAALKTDPGPAGKEAVCKIVTKVLGDKGPLNEFTGAWAFLKLFDAATLARRSDDRWEAFLPNGARLELQWKSLKNPLSARAALNNFQCVPL